MFEASVFDFVQILVGVSHVLSALFDHFVILVLMLGILIFIMQQPLYLSSNSYLLVVLIHL